jgi:formylglycine-generating enzyme required for sulfatase activity
MFIEYFNNFQAQYFGPQDQLILYISAYFHKPVGGSTNYIVPSDGDLNDLSTCISVNQLQEVINQLSCNRVLIILDPFEIGEVAPPITIADNFAQVTMSIGGRAQTISSGFIIDELEDQLIIVAPYTRPSTQDLKLFGPGYKIELDRSATEFDAFLLKEYPQEGIAFFQVKNTEQYQWESDFYYSDLKRGQQVDVALKDPSKQGLPPQGQITELNDEGFSARLNNPSNSDNFILVDGKIAGLITTPPNGNNTVTGQPFDYILSLWENTIITDLDRIVPPETDLPGMVFVQGGTFQMGDQFGDGEREERPVHNVTLSDFYISDHEVTFAEYEAYCNAAGKSVPNDGGMGKGNRPVINVSWDDAIAYCNWKSEQAGLEKVYTIAIKGEEATANWTANGYRLPTEAEWEYAARSRGEKEKWAGTNEADSLILYANYGDKVEVTQVARSYKPNALGLYDMTGNVSEWCWDRHNYNSYDNSNNVRDPRGSVTGSSRVFRGGSWFSSRSECRVSYRPAKAPTSRSDETGFRLVSSSR